MPDPQPSNPVTPLAVLSLVLQYGPSVIGLVQKLRTDVANGNKPLTDADWTELTRLSTQSAEDIYKRVGVTPPPS